MGTATDIRSGIFAEVEKSGLASVAWPNISHSGVYPFVQVHILSASADTVGLSGISRFSGVIQIDCNVAAGGGEITASNLADDVLAIFPRGTKITSGTTTIQINETGWASTGQQTPDGYFIPVSIPYEVLT